MNFSKTFRPAPVALLLAALCLGPPACLPAQPAASDTVHVWDEQGATQTRIRGTIQAYDRNVLTILTVSGREQQVPSDRVARLESRWDRQQLDADRAFASGEFERADGLYRQALENEKRDWVRHRLVAQLVWCQQATGKWPEAGNLFLKSVLGSNPQTPYFDAIPLVWKTPAASQPMERLGKTWLVDERSRAANLLGASWLLASTERELAIQVLRELAVGEDRQIAFLAETQLWRIQVPTVSAAAIEEWEKLLSRMPKAMRAGPYHLLGNALHRIGRSQDGLIAWMRVPLQYPRHRLLAAESLLSTARYYQEAGKREQATTLCRELVSGFPTTIAGQVAQDLLQELTEK
jgi:tetratricopeptide (TPR) repeat protein